MRGRVITLARGTAVLWVICLFGCAGPGLRAKMERHYRPELAEVIFYNPSTLQSPCGLLSPCLLR